MGVALIRSTRIPSPQKSNGKPLKANLQGQRLRELRHALAKRFVRAVADCKIHLEPWFRWKTVFWDPILTEVVGC